MVPGEQLTDIYHVRVFIETAISKCCIFGQPSYIKPHYLEVLKCWALKPELDFKPGPLTLA